MRRPRAPEQLITPSQDLLLPTPPAVATQSPSGARTLVDLLNRPATERRREYKYRFAQSTVFGLPVLALRLFGPTLGGPEALRWIGLMSALLAGWVVYVGALPMLVEAILRRRPTLDGVAAAAAVGGYAAALFTTVRLLATGVVPDSLTSWGFGFAVVVCIAWNGARWAIPSLLRTKPFPR
jgi:hypothetical protein